MCGKLYNSGIQLPRFMHITTYGGRSLPSYSRPCSNSTTGHEAIGERGSPGQRLRACSPEVHVLNLYRFDSILSTSICCYESPTRDWTSSLLSWTYPGKVCSLFSL
jgi:hypothetical protein